MQKEVFLVTDAIVEKPTYLKNFFDLLCDFLNPFWQKPFAVNNLMHL